MDYFVELSYPKNLDPKKKANFSTRFRRLVPVKIRRSEYLIDREDILEKVKKLASEFGIQIKIIEYKELPNSLKEKLEKASKISEVDDKKIQDYLEKIKVMKKSLLYYDDLFQKIAEANSRDIDDIILSADSTLIDKGLKIAREELA